MIAKSREGAEMDLDLVSIETIKAAGVRDRTVIRCVLPDRVTRAVAADLVAAEISIQLRCSPRRGVIVFAHASLDHLRRGIAFLTAAATRDGAGFRDGWLLDPLYPDYGRIQVMFSDGIMCHLAVPTGQGQGGKTYLDAISDSVHALDQAIRQTPTGRAYYWLCDHLPAWARSSPR